MFSFQSIRGKHHSEFLSFFNEKSGTFWTKKDLVNNLKMGTKIGLGFLGETMVSAAVYELVTGGFEITHLIAHDAKSAEQTASAFIEKVHIMDSRHKVTFQIPDGEWEIIKVLQDLGCEAKLQAHPHLSRDSWKLTLDATDHKVNF